MSTTIDARRAVSDLLHGLGLDPALATQVTFTGTDAVYDTPYRIGTAAGAALAAAQLVAADLSHAPASFALDLDVAALTTQGYRHVRLEGASVAAPRDPLTGLYGTADGRQIFLHVNFPHHRDRLLGILGAQPAKDSIAAAVATWRAERLEAALAEAGAIAAMARSPEEWAASDQGRAVAALPPVEVTRIGESAPEPARLGPGSGRLSVVDFTRVLAGPTCGRLLAECGASVTRIDNPLYPDLVSYALDANRDKAQVALDLRDPAQHARLLDMIGSADVFMQAYRPGVAEGFGLGTDEPAERRPGLIHASLSAYGHLGPWRDRRGFDSVLQAATGMAMEEGDGIPRLLATSPLDYAAGYLLAFGALVALKRRSETGGSYRVRTSLAQTAHWLGGLGLRDTRASDFADFDAYVAANSIVSPGPLGSVTHIRSPIRSAGTATKALGSDT